MDAEVLGHMNLFSGLAPRALNGLAGVFAHKTALSGFSSLGAVEDSRSPPVAPVRSGRLVEPRLPAWVAPDLRTLRSAPRASRIGSAFPHRKMLCLA